MTFEELINTVAIDVDENLGDTTFVNKIKNFINRGYKDLAKNENLENCQEVRCLVKVEDSLCLLNAEELQSVIDDKIEELVDWLDNE